MKIKCLLITLFYMVQANAIDNWSSGKIIELRVQSVYERVLITQENATYPNVCSKSDFIELPITSDPINASMYSALLTAHSTGKNVALGVTGCSRADRPVVTDIVLKP